jgi:hypothetical protein
MEPATTHDSKVEHELVPNKELCLMEPQVNLLHLLTSGRTGLWADGGFWAGVGMENVSA